MLITNSVPGVVDYKSLMLGLVCNTENKHCILHYCDKRPGVFGVKKHLGALVDDFDEDDTLNIRQWSQQSDYLSLLAIKVSIRELIEKICEQFDKLRTHHYVVKSQSAYL